MTTIENKTIYAVGYCRVSTEGQTEESLDNQQREIQKFADENNIKMIEWYKDHGYSGTTDKRPALLRMVSDSKNKKFSKVLVWRFDRFSRDPLVSAIVKDSLKKNNVSVYSVVERTDQTPGGKFIEGIYDLVNQLQVATIASNTLGGMKENARKGLSNGGRVPFGYKRVPKLDEHGNPVKKSNKRGISRVVNTYDIHPENAEAVKLMYQMTVEGYTRKEILEKIQSLGYKNTAGGNMNPTNIDKILRDEKYTGIYIFTYNKGPQVNYAPIETIRNEGGMPQIIQRELFDTVQVILDKRMHRQPKLAEDDYMFTGKIVCGECGTAYVGWRKIDQIKGVYNYYKCNGKANKKNGCCNACVRRDDVEEFVIDQINDIVFNENIIDQMLEEYNNYAKTINNNDSVVNMLKNKIKDIDIQINNIVNAIADGFYSKTIQEKLYGLEQQKEQTFINLQTEQRTCGYNFATKQELQKAFEKAREILNDPTADFETRKLLVQSFLNKIIVYKDRIKVFINILPFPLCKGTNLIVQNTSLINDSTDYSVNCDNTIVSPYTLPIQTLCIGRIRNFARGFFFF